MKNATLKAIEYIHRNKMYVVGGLTVGNPDDTPESIQANLDFARPYIDWPYIQHPKPYPRTPMTKDFQERGLIISDLLEEYDGTSALVRSTFEPKAPCRCPANQSCSSTLASFRIPSALGQTVSVLRHHNPDFNCGV
jgi:hypothetical protein